MNVSDHQDHQRQGDVGRDRLDLVDLLRAAPPTSTLPGRVDVADLADQVERRVVERRALRDDVELPGVIAEEARLGDLRDAVERAERRGVRRDVGGRPTPAAVTATMTGEDSAPTKS